ncbi:MAG: hypothetical protein WAQ28_08185 [Bacteroidia bacterium]|jgi:hypothetical protein
MKRFIYLLTFSVLFLNSTAAEYYWVGGTGNWSDYINHWATTSGGSVFHVQIPSPIDNVHFDSNSFITAADTVFLDSTLVNCKNMDWTGATGFPMLAGISNSAIGIYGSLTLSSNMKCLL